MRNDWIDYLLDLRNRADGEYPRPTGLFRKRKPWKEDPSVQKDNYIPPDFSDFERSQLEDLEPQN